MRYKVTVEVGGYWEDHTTDLDKDEAEALAKDLTETFPEERYWVQEDDEPKDERHYNEKAVDGWEDLFSR